MVNHSPLLLETLFVQEQGTYLGLNAGQIEVRRYKDVLQSFPCEWIKQIMLFGRCTLTSGMVDYCVQHNIPVIFLTQNGYYRSSLYYRSFPSIRLVKKQLKLSRDLACRLPVAQSIVKAKLFNQRYLLMERNSRKKSNYIAQQMEIMRSMIDQIQPATTLEALRGYEGRGAVAFFDSLVELAPSDFRFQGRNKRPPKDPVNVLLSFGYTLLYRFMESLIISQRLHPAIGCFHDQMNRFSCLASDLMEEFRAPIVDSLALKIVNLGIIQSNQFTFESDRCIMSDQARKQFLIEFSKKLNQGFKHAEFDRPITYLICMTHQVRNYAAMLRTPEKAYKPFLSGGSAN